MDFLVHALLWWVLAAFAFGLIVGWFSCGVRRPDGA
jgi:hypothetical protein